MSGLPWIKVAVDFVDDPKMLALVIRTSDPRSPLHLPAVWGHFARHYADGSMPDTEDAQRALERAALWGGRPGTLVSALLDVGLLERRRKRIEVHAWEEWQEGHARKLDRDRERMRAKRAEGRKNRSATVAERSSDGRAGEERERREREEETEIPLDAPRGTTPQGRALDHWNATVWPKLSTSSPPRPTSAAMTLLARRCKDQGESEVIAAMDRARAELESGDAWLLKNLTLQVFLSDSQFPKFLPRAAPGRANGPSRTGMIPAAPADAMEGGEHVL